MLLALTAPQAVYGGEAGTAQAQINSLPFTGFDLYLLIGGGILLLLVGVGLMLFSKSVETTS